MNFDGVSDLLDNSVPPEITNYHQGHHPGLGWWLKTAVPTNDSLGVLAAWRTIQRKHPSTICITEVAYDWHGAVIPLTASIWLRDNLDVDLTWNDPEFNYVIMPFDDSVNSWGQYLRRQLLQYRRQPTKDFDKSNWHNLVAVANLLKQWTTNRQAQVKRKGWKVVSNKQTNSGHQSQ
jgi:hypothetical protein